MQYIYVRADDFEEDCEQLLESIGDENVVRIIATPSTYVHAVDEELSGITVLVIASTPVSRSLLRPTLCTGTSEFDLTTMEDGSAISMEKLRQSTFAFNACVREKCSEKDGFHILLDKPQDWEPTLGRDCVDAIRITRQYVHAERRYRWKLFVTSGLDYAASELLEAAIDRGWSIQQLYRSQEYIRLCKAAAANRNRIAYAAAVSLGLSIPRSKYEPSMTASRVHYFAPTFSSLHHTIIEKDFGPDDGGLIYAVHIETYPLHAYQRLPFMRSGEMMMVVFEPKGNVGKRSWQNKYANSFPSGCGFRAHSDLRAAVEKWNPESAYGDDHCEKRWESMVSFNLYSMNDVYKPWQHIQSGLEAMGMTAHWKYTEMEVVMLKIASMKEEKLTAFELLKTKTVGGRVRVPIYSNVFRGGANYKGLWDVYSLQDPPPAAILSEYSIPGYVDIDVKYVVRIAVANREMIEESYESSDHSSSSSSSPSESDCDAYSDEESFEIED